jgi:signal recognition particle receptor subunit beta
VHSETPTRVAVGPIPVKIVVAGGFGVGKTTFVGAISDIKPLTTEAAMTTFGEGIDNRGDVGTKTTTTVAMDFGRVAVDDAIVLYLFGTPGQDRFGFMWNDLIQGALGAVVLVDSRRIEDSFPALDYFEHRDLPFVVAINRFGGQMFHSLDEIREALSISEHVPVVSTDARGRVHVKETVLSLLDVVLQRAMSRAKTN